MFTRILVPLDGGSLSERALNVAAQLARASSGALLFVSVVAPPIRHEFGEYDVWSAETVDENVGKAERYLDHVSGLPALEGHGLAGASSAGGDLIPEGGSGRHDQPWTEWPLTLAAGKRQPPRGALCRRSGAASARPGLDAGIIQS
jgi:nucleotide-binding universal stress UspA family protein